MARSEDGARLTAEAVEEDVGAVVGMGISGTQEAKITGMGKARMAARSAREGFLVLIAFIF
jgi:hypothetical protein